MDTDDYEATFRQPARRAWLALKKFFEHYKVHMWITEELDPRAKDPNPQDDQIGIRWEITYGDKQYVVIDYAAYEEYPEYYTICGAMCTAGWLSKVLPAGVRPPAKIMHVLNKLSKILDMEDQIELSRNTLYVHGVPMITLRSGLDARSFTANYPTLNSERY